MPLTKPYIDLLMITYNRAAYTRMALDRLLATVPESARVWVWHNGNHSETLEVVESMRGNPKFHRFHHSPENKKLREPTNWFWSHAEGEYLGKVDDDCLMPTGWCDRLIETHRGALKFGILGSWLFREEDLNESLVAAKTVQYGGNHAMANPWVGGAGYLMKRACLEKCGLLRDGESFSRYCMRVARAGWINGWPLPMIMMDHMDDPRSEHTVFRNDDDVLKHRGLTAERIGINTLDQFMARVQDAALELQTCSPNWQDYIGWRAKIRRVFSGIIR